MKNLNLIYKENPKARNLLKGDFNSLYKAYVFRCNDDLFTGDTIKKIIMFVQGVKKKPNASNVPIRFEFSKMIIFADKLSYVIFECLCYSLTESGHKVQLSIKPKPHMLTEGVLSSPLLNLNHRDIKGFKERFIKIFDYNHYRRLVSVDSNPDILSIITTDVAAFLKGYGIEFDAAFQLGELVAELVGNSHEHAGSDCLVDIDVSGVHEHKKEAGEFLSINLAVLNFSSKKFGDLLKNNLSNSFNNESKYTELQELEVLHRSYFSESYNQDVFYTIASLQPKISGKYEKAKVRVGGVGTLKLVKALKEKSYEDQCYVLSGKTIVRFRDGLFSLEKDWIGFNKDNDFSNPPDEEAFIDCPIDFSGTAYNLNFILKISEGGI